MEDRRSSESKNDALFRRVLNNIDDAANDGVILNEMLAVFQRGFPIGNLLRLLNSQQDPTVRAGAWLLAELGTRSCVIFQDVKGLLASPDSRVRFFVADSVLLCATSKDTESICELAHLIEDSESALRWKALDTLVKLSREQVSVCHKWLQATASQTPYAKGFGLMAAADSDKLPELKINDYAQSSDTILKKLTFVAAVRARWSRNILARIAAASQDQDLQDFMKDFR